jgi:hypothetical protein
MIEIRQKTSPFPSPWSTTLPHEASSVSSVTPNKEEFTVAVRRFIIFLVACCDWVPMLLLGVISMRNVRAGEGVLVFGEAAAVVIWCVK